MQNVLVLKKVEYMPSITWLVGIDWSYNSVTTTLAGRRQLSLTVLAYLEYSIESDL